MLPDTPIVWIQTTWEGGRHPVKVAPYTSGMLDTYRNNILACLMLSTSNGRGKFNVRATDKILYALAPLPYATGLFPLALGEEIGMEFLPPVKDAVKMTFSERNKLGFKMGLKRGIEFFFGVGSVATYVSHSLSSMGGKSSSGSSGSRLAGLSPLRLLRLAAAKYRCKQEGRELKPRDLFKLKGFMCAGTDNACYKDELEELWGVRPMELFAGTEPSCIGTETWTRDGMYFFPDTCFYEFIPEDEMEKSFDDPSYAVSYTHLDVYKRQLGPVAALVQLGIDFTEPLERTAFISERLHRLLPGDHLLGIAAQTAEHPALFPETAAAVTGDRKPDQKAERRDKHRHQGDERVEGQHEHETEQYRQYTRNQLHDSLVEAVRNRVDIVGKPADDVAAGMGIRCV